MNPAQLKNEELPRMQTVVKNFIVIKCLVIAQLQVFRAIFISIISSYVQFSVFYENEPEN